MPLTKTCAQSFHFSLVIWSSMTLWECQRRTLLHEDRRCLHIPDARLLVPPSLNHFAVEFHVLLATIPLRKAHEVALDLRTVGEEVTPFRIGIEGECIIMALLFISTRDLKYCSNGRRHLYLLEYHRLRQGMCSRTTCHRTPCSCRTVSAPSCRPRASSPSCMLDIVQTLLRPRMLLVVFVACYDIGRVRCMAPPLHVQDMHSFGPLR